MLTGGAHSVVREGRKEEVAGGCAREERKRARLATRLRKRETCRGKGKGVWAERKENGLKEKDFGPKEYPEFKLIYEF